MGEETIAAELVLALIEREWKLGTVECGVDGIVSHRIFDTPDGVTVLGNSLIVDDVKEAIGLLGLPRPQFKKAGDFSAKAARAAAREGRAFLGVNVCLAVWGPAATDNSDAQKTIHIACHTGRDVLDQTLHLEEEKERAVDWIVEQSLNLVRSVLL